MTADELRRLADEMGDPKADTVSLIRWQQQVMEAAEELDASDLARRQMITMCYGIGLILDGHADMRQSVDPEAVIRRVAHMVDDHRDMRLAVAAFVSAVADVMEDQS